MDFETMIANMTPDIYQSLKRGVELGKWPDGRPLSQQQKELCMEAVLNYEQRFVAEEQRTGYIDRGHKEEGEKCGDNNPEQPLKWH